MNRPDDRTEQLNGWLDAALERYSRAEPHPALESRILANVRVGRERSARRWMWGTSLGLAAAGLLVALAFGLVQHKDHGPVVSKLVPRKSDPLSAVATNESAKGAKNSRLPANLTAKSNVTAARSFPRNGERQASVIAMPEEVKGPRLGQFPSSRPDSEQARLLAAYLRNAPPGEVVTVATATNSIQDLAIPDLRVAPLSGEAENSNEER